MRRGPLGPLRARVFAAAHHYFLDWMVLRDDERWSTDRITMRLRLLVSEWGRRLRERGLLQREDDQYFLTIHELDELTAQPFAPPLVQAKIAGRRRNFARACDRQLPPDFIHRDRPFEVQDEEHHGDALRGTGTSNGLATGTARVVPDGKDLGRMQKGEILVCHATDPGWTPVFGIVGGVVIETGGVLAHASRLSREYGLPAVQLRNAMQLIPDGATLTVNGTSGEVFRDDQASTVASSSPATSSAVSAQA